MALRQMDSLPVEEGTRVLVRVDFNVPLAEDGTVADDTRIRESLSTINRLRERGARVILMSHLGRPHGRPDPKLSLLPAARRLQELLGSPVTFVPATVGHEAEAAVAAAGPGDVLVLENLRFDPREEQNDANFARALADLGDVYVNDAFGSAHRAHASTEAVAHLLPAAAGDLLVRELWALDDILGRPDRPYWVVVGGAKVSDKIGLLKALMPRADGMVVGGGMANTFLAAAGKSMGASRVEPDAVTAAAALMNDADRLGCPIVLPVDVVVTTEFAAEAAARVTGVDSIAEGEMALDIGPQSIRAIEAALRDARTVFWNGPMGVFEWDRFRAGTDAVARILAGLDARVVVGGGDSVSAVNQTGLQDRLTHISTGGGAALEFLEGRALPGVEALQMADE